MKFTFKRHRDKWHEDRHDIKLKRKVVGAITHIGQTWRIRFAVIKDDILEDGNPNCEWKWIILKKKSDTPDEAKEWLNKNINVIIDNFNLHMME